MGKSILYVPSDVPFTLQQGQLEQMPNGLRLYVRKVLISDEFDLMPRYLSFVKGVIDSDDLPLNVNRETLQESKIISIIRKKVTRKVIDMIKKFADDSSNVDEAEVEIDEDGNIIEPEDNDEASPKENEYLKWYENFSPSIKMGVMDDDANRNRLAKLLRVKTSKSDGEWISLSDYVEGMKDYQKEIYFIAGSTIKEVENSPFMEKFNEKDLEVVYTVETADEYMIERLMEFDGKKFSSITKENIKFGYEDKVKKLTKFMNKFYGSAVMSTKISQRLGSIPAIASSSAYGHSANMERIMRAQVFAHGQDESQVRGFRTLEINPRHPFIEKILEQLPEEDDFDAKDLPQDFRDSLWSLLDTALLNGGFPLNDGKAFTKRMIRTLKSQLAVDSLDLLPEIEPKVEEDVPPEPELDGDGINLDDFVADDLEFEDI